MIDFDTLLFDRVEIIKTVNAKYDIEHNGYISFSGDNDYTQYSLFDFIDED